MVSNFFSSLVDLVGKPGTVITSLQLAGDPLIGEHRVDIVTQGEFVRAKTEIAVILSKAVVLFTVYNRMGIGCRL